MQKKLIALAVAAALTAPALALADSANVTVYGKLIADIESVQSDKATGANVAVAAGSSYTANRVVSNASRLGVKGEEDLGDGLKAFFQIESNVNLTGTDVAAGIFNGIRNSGAGLKSDSMGAVSVGNWDTPYKLTHNKIELFDNTTFASATNLIGRSAATAANASQGATLASNFVTRQAGVVQYYSPKFSGFDVKVAFAPASDTFAVANNAATKQNKAVVSMSGTFETDDIYVALGYESHNDAFAPTATRLSTGADTATRLVGSYKIADGFWVGATVEQVSVTGATAVATGTKTSSRTGFELATSYKMDKNNFGLSYVKLGNMGSAVSSGANQVSVRYGYDLSKRTQAFAMYSALSNDANGNYGLSAGQNIASAAGAKFTGFGAGLQHSF
jgi:predicted porin